MRRCVCGVSEPTWLDIVDYVIAGSKAAAHVPVTRRAEETQQQHEAVRTGFLVYEVTEHEEAKEERGGCWEGEKKHE